MQTGFRRRGLNMAIILHLSVCIGARCWFPTLWRHYGITESHKWTGLPFTSTRHSLFHGTTNGLFVALSSWHRCRAMHTGFRWRWWWLQSMLLHELFKGITCREVIQCLLSTFGLKRRLGIYAAKKNNKNSLFLKDEIKLMKGCEDFFLRLNSSAFGRV